MSAIKLSTPSSGSISLSPANTASNLTITVPAVTGTMLTNKTAGTVLQVVNATYGTQVTNSTSTYADTGLSATITPTSSTSKILVIVNQAGVGKGAGDADLGVRLRILRDSTAIFTFIDRFAYTNSLLQITLGVGTSYLDSPSTTSAVTYKTQFACWNTSVANVFVQGASGNSTITLMEIAQ